jgi:hypothetical protein
VADDVTSVERPARIETKLDMWHNAANDHETRLRRLERLMWVAVGISMTRGSGLSQWLSSGF